MAGGATPGARELDQTPTWAVSAVCAAIIVISIILEKVLHHIGEFFQKRKKKALFEALDKVKNELMVLGFISLLLTFGQNYISKFCVPARFADTMLPCPIGGNEQYMKTHGPATNPGHQPPSGLHEPGASPQPPAPVHETGSTRDPPAAEVREPGNVPSGGKVEHHRRLLWFERRSLAGGSPTVGCKQGHLPLISVNGLHQLHIFIFFLAVFHVIYSCITMALGKLKIRGWKDWEKETVRDHEMLNDPARFRLTHETSFVKGHNSFWTKTPVLFYIVCFLRQFSRSVRRADYLTMRHGFISVHLAPGSKFDFQKYIKRSLEDDFKVVVGISPLLWASVVLFLLMNVDGWQAMFWISVLPLVVTLAVGTKLQAIIAQMALEIQEKHAVVQGIPLVQVSDRNFWFSWPPLVLYLIHFVLFQNAFEITYFFWIWYEFGLESCFHSNFTFVIVRVCLGIGAQFLCSYSTLPLYALVTQMGSTMKRSVFDEQTSKALKQWHQKAVKKKTEEGMETEMRTRVLGGSPGDSPMDSPSNHRRPNSTSVGGEMSDIDAHTASPHRTANIVASVDLPGDQQHQRNDNNGLPDLLTGP